MYEVNLMWKYIIKITIGLIYHIYIYSILNLYMWKCNLVFVENVWKNLVTFSKFGASVFVWRKITKIKELDFPWFSRKVFQIRDSKNFFLHGRRKILWKSVFHRPTTRFRVHVWQEEVVVRKKLFKFSMQPFFDYFMQCIFLEENEKLIIW